MLRRCFREPPIVLIPQIPDQISKVSISTLKSVFLQPMVEAGTSEEDVQEKL